MDMRNTVFPGITAAFLMVAAGAAQAATIFADDFNRPAGNSVGNGWAERESEADDVAIFADRLRLRDFVSDALPSASALQTGLTGGGLVNISVSFDWRGINLESDDRFYFGWAAAGTDALAVDLWTNTGFNSTDDQWRSATISLASVPNLFDVMFWSKVSQRSEGFAIDNFTVSGDVPAPVPLPAAGWLMLAGIGGLAAAGRRRRRAG
ncbi:VPLPA-CTERM sorting domain-containing protein [Maritimibacter sp. 55A14]|uniref:VPLPA-CTERM sorting domain-containing protein n=1 Tax=Maritimibacter sp. 55A14 TaxID=2174844 RepID=UPI001E2AD2AE|nr:VPLPA-CTERM sorting domain-containing protein [Maritimibacter sp. 55A14]